RTGLAPGKTPREVEDALVANTPAEFRKDAHHWLILHGRYVCTARKPACPTCIIRDLCEYRHKTPAKPARKKAGRLARAIRAHGAARARSGRGRRRAHGERAAEVPQGREGSRIRCSRIRSAPWTPPALMASVVPN